MLVIKNDRLLDTPYNQWNGNDVWDLNYTTNMNSQGNYYYSDVVADGYKILGMIPVQKTIIKEIFMKIQEDGFPFSSMFYFGSQSTSGGFKMDFKFGS